MQKSLSYTHVFHLVRELRRAAIENEIRAEWDEGSLHLCLGAALANDAADALQALVAERAGNDDGCRPQRSAS